MLIAAAGVAVAIVALLHLAFLVLEMFLWTKPAGARIFGLSAEMASATARLAANQGLYNGLLAGGLLWSLARGAAGFESEVLFLACVIVAGLYGGMTTKRSILWLQFLPGAVALALVLLARR